MGMMYEDMADYLVTKGLGIKEGVGANMFGGRMPNLPDFLIALYEHTGFEPERAMGNTRIDQLTLQIIVRAPKATDAHTRASAIYTALDVDFNKLTDAQRTINGTLYLSVLARHAPFGLGQDENNRYKWTCSYIVRRD